MQRLILFAKRPRLGRVKTRLVPPLSSQQALDLYRVFLDDSARLVATLQGSVDVELCLDGPVGDEGLPPEAARLSRSEQGEGDMGERLHRAFVRARDQGRSATVVIGADSPNLPPDRISAAFRSLTEKPNPVMSPSADGGYVLLGLREPSPVLFQDVGWGGPDVAAATRARALSLGQPLIELPPWYDVDDQASLRRLMSDLEACGEATAPATRAHLGSLDGAYSAML
jgi:rSAM/selenodomain-associated transferase 1